MTSLKHSYAEAHLLPLGYSVVRGQDGRSPLTNAAGNTQVLQLSDLEYHGKIEPEPYASSILSFQHPQPLPSRSEQALGQADKQTIRRDKRYLQFQKNPILKCQAYQAYRQRQAQSNRDDQTWPDVLEAAFLDGAMHPSRPFPA